MLLHATASPAQNQFYDRSGGTAVSTDSNKKQGRTRPRSNSWSSTFYSSTIVPASSQNEALSSLITSLTALSNTALDQSGNERQALDLAASEEPGDIIGRIGTDPGFHSAFYEDRSWIDNCNDEYEQGFCPPPVAGYNTINADKLPPRPKTSGAEKNPRRFKHRKIQTQLKSSRSKSNLEVARPSRNLQSPDSVHSTTQPRTSCGNESISSLPLSTHSKVSRTRSPLKMFFSSRLGTDKGQEKSDLQTEYPRSPSEMPPALSDKENDAHRFSAFVSLGHITTDLEKEESDSRTLSSMSPSHRTGLTENLIPSRRSSLKVGPRRPSRESRDLKSLNIDQDLIEENHETVQRIRELQEAREKRHHEWRKEARRSEKAAKRLSMPSSSSSPVKHSNSVRSSWHPAVDETPEDETPPQLSATINGTDLQNMSAGVDVTDRRPHTPTDPQRNTDEDIGVRRNLSVSGSIAPSRSSGQRHRKRFSDSIKRASLVKSPLEDDAKNVTEEVEAYLGSPKLTQKIRHPRTGRTIAFSEVGDPEGFAVLCCVGMGLTRYVSAFYDDIARTHKLRIITPDRPGVGETEAMPTERTTPLGWVDDVAVICTSLGIEKFSLLAHSAGAIYALATALKMPQYVRGRIHLLGPWIPPSQLASSAGRGDLKAANLPTAHKILSFLPSSFMKAANSRFLVATSASIEPRAIRDRKKERLASQELALDADLFNQEASLSTADFSLGSMLPTPETTPKKTSSQQNSAQYPSVQMRSPPRSPTPGQMPYSRSHTLSPTPTSWSGARTPSHHPGHKALNPQARQKLYDATLAHRTWALATLNANPAVDLIICLERKRPIGFRYTDITRAVVIHHGVNDTRVPLENARWLSTVMKRCELNGLENEGHGLMASATVMANVLAEVSKEWDEWSKIVDEKEKERRKREVAEEEAAREKERAFRRGYPKW